MKCGTASLFKYLEAHPDTIASSVKETDFFCQRRTDEASLREYAGYFVGPGQVPFEASPCYAMRHIYPGVPEAIREVLPDVRLVYLVRDPIERIVSHYMHEVARGQQRLPLPQVLKNEDVLRSYVDTSRYSFQLKAYLECFDRRQILVVESERLAVDTLMVVNQVCAFVGLKPMTDDAVVASKYHVSTSKRSPSVIEQALNARVENRLLQRLYRRALARFGTPVRRPELDEESRDKLRDFLIHDAAELRELTGCGFESWSV